MSFSIVKVTWHYDRTREREREREREGQRETPSERGQPLRLSVYGRREMLWHGLLFWWGAALERPLR